MIELTDLLSSRGLGYSKKLWIFRPESSFSASRLLVFTDAEIYLRRLGAQELIRPFVDGEESEPTCAVFVSSGTEQQRMSESLFHRGFSSFLCQELRAYVLEQQLVAPDAKASLCGVSLTGLATVVAAIHFPGVYEKVAAQSGAYWPEEGRVLRELEALPSGVRQAFYFDVGSEETDREGEVMSQQEGIEAVRRVLEKKGYPVKTYVFQGDHSVQGWRSALPQYLDWARSRALNA